jgi:excisionase family DNA binding protein
MPKRTKLLSMSEAAALLGIHVVTLYRWCEQGDIAYIKSTPRSPRRFRREDVLELLEPTPRQTEQPA